MGGKERAAYVAPYLPRAMRRWQSIYGETNGSRPSITTRRAPPDILTPISYDSLRGSTSAIRPLDSTQAHIVRTETRSYAKASRYVLLCPGRPMSGASAAPSECIRSSVPRFGSCAQPACPNMTSCMYHTSRGLFLLLAEQYTHMLCIGIEYVHVLISGHMSSPCSWM
ncbi:hypothetical protein BC628DRAFT_702332 [Trametes gibbosa]|nr:hypothetical protein BC628DRAFT_702332 [Trametes gibbosa]